MSAHDSAALAAVTAVFALVLAAAEGARAGGARAETTRKLVHVLSGLVTAAFPWLFAEPSPVLGLALGYAVLMTLSRRLGLLRAVHGVSRPTDGTLYYPAAVALLFVLARHRPAAYAAALLVLAVADAAAALAGRSARVLRYTVFGQRKSAAGSLAFLACAIPCVLGPLLAWSDLSTLGCLAWSVHAAVLATCAEALCPHGSDNLGVPLTTGLVVLYALSASHLPPLWPLAAAGALVALGCAWSGRRVERGWSAS
jgi:phytol kinase